MEMASITLTDAHHQLLRAAVDAGEYASVSEAIRDALRQGEIQRRVREAELEDLRLKSRKASTTSKLVDWDTDAVKARDRARWEARRSVAPSNV